MWLWKKRKKPQQNIGDPNIPSQYYKPDSVLLKTIQEKLYRSSEERSPTMLHRWRAAWGSYLLGRYPEMPKI
ncbi:MAG: hypothetical protein RML93_05530, partial [Anaerolineales bacterium]|nr:hypothetical protein [Anaerolineales bacterium]MDW8446736.1 hypothetical protein [Anaerolineales bacterium]